MKRASIAVVAVVWLTVSAAQARADVDTDFSQRLHSSGIYGPLDYEAWLGKIVCKRLATGVDPDGAASVRFISANLSHGSTSQQGGQFLAAALMTYCPDRAAVLTAPLANGH